MVFRERYKRDNRINHDAITILLSVLICPFSSSYLINLPFDVKKPLKVDRQRISTDANRRMDKEKGKGQGKKGTVVRRGAENRMEERNDARTQARRAENQRGESLRGGSVSRVRGGTVRRSECTFSTAVTRTRRDTRLARGVRALLGAASLAFWIGEAKEIRAAVFTRESLEQVRVIKDRRISQSVRRRTIAKRGERREKRTTFLSFSTFLVSTHAIGTSKMHEGAR